MRLVDDFRKRGGRKETAAVSETAAVLPTITRSALRLGVVGLVAYQMVRPPSPIIP